MRGYTALVALGVRLSTSPAFLAECPRRWLRTGTLLALRTRYRIVLVVLAVPIFAFVASLKRDGLTRC